jgi:hypothetical protein
MTANYSTHDLEGRVAAALAVHRHYIEEMEERYREGLRRRRAAGIPTLAVLGYGRAGKDTAAEYLCAQTGLVYAGSSSDRLCRFVAHAAGIGEKEAFAERHSHRAFWKDVGDLIRGLDLLLLVRIALGWGDMAVGLRGGHEVRNCPKAGVDVRVWVENGRVPPDFTVEFTADDCDLVVPNNGPVEEFHANLRQALPQMPWKK